MEFSRGSVGERAAKVARAIASGIMYAGFLMCEGFEQANNGEAGLRATGQATDFDGNRVDGDEIVTPSGMRVPIVAECSLEGDE